LKLIVYSVYLKNIYPKLTVDTHFVFQLSVQLLFETAYNELHATDISDVHKKHVYHHVEYPLLKYNLTQN